MHTSFIYYIQSPKYMSTCKRFLYRERFLNPKHYIYIYNLLLLLTPIAKAFFGCSFPFTTYNMYVLKKRNEKFKIVTNQCRKQ